MNRIPKTIRDGNSLPMEVVEAPPLTFLCPGYQTETPPPPPFPFFFFFFNDARPVLQRTPQLEAPEYRHVDRGPLNERILLNTGHH